MSSPEASSRHLIVKENAVQVSKLFNENAETKDDAILKTLESIQNGLRALEIKGETESKAKRGNSLNMSRKIFMSTQYRLQKQKLLILGSLYNGDQKLADEVSAIFAEDKNDPPYLNSLMKSALREMLMESTDDFTSSLKLVAKPGIRLLGGLAILDHKADHLLQEFFDLCREPNMAEIEMLAKACRAPLEIVSAWFALKREQTQRLFVMRGLATKGSRLGTKLRKREHQLRQGRTLRPSLPAEFADPDLNEGWEELAASRVKFEI